MIVLSFVHWCQVRVGGGAGLEFWDGEDGLSGLHFHDVYANVTRVFFAGLGFWVLGYLFTASAAVEIARRVVGGEFKAGYQVRGVQAWRDRGVCISKEW